MWKHKNFINLQLYAGPQPFSISVNGTMVLIERLSDSMVPGEETWSYNASINTDKYTISGNTVVWNDGTILQYNGVDVVPTDNIVFNGQYTTRSATPTLTFKHFFDAGTIGTGAVKFRHYSQQEPIPQEYTDCITFTGESSDFTLSIVGAKEWDGTVEYSTDHENWTTWDGSEISSSGQKLYLRGSGNTKFWTSKGAQLSLSKRAACSGNIQTLLEYSNPPTSIPTAHCYESMFSGCTSLTKAPALPATTLADYCYNAMFQFCTSLTTAPELPAITLATWCYFNMFYDCTSLTKAPALPATTLADFCYYLMFNGCTSLKISSAKSSEYPTAWRIPSSGIISSTPTLWNFNMLSDTGGTFTSDPSINTTYYGAW